MPSWMLAGGAVGAVFGSTQRLVGAILPAWLGHADNAFTLRTYVHSQNDALDAAAEMLQTIVWRDDPQRTADE